MKFKLFAQVALSQDYPNHHLCSGDVATIVEHHSMTNVTVAESEIEALSPNEVLHVRVLEAA